MKTPCKLPLFLLAHNAMKPMRWGTLTLLWLALSVAAIAQAPTTIPVTDGSTHTGVTAVPFGVIGGTQVWTNTGTIGTPRWKLASIGITGGGSGANFTNWTYANFGALGSNNLWLGAQTVSNDLTVTGSVLVGGGLTVSTNMVSIGGELILIQTNNGNAVSIAGLHTFSPGYGAFEASGGKAGGSNSVAFGPSANVSGHNSFGGGDAVDVFADNSFAWNAHNQSDASNSVAFNCGVLGVDNPYSFAFAGRIQPQANQLSSNIVVFCTGDVNLTSANSFVFSGRFYDSGTITPATQLMNSQEVANAIAAAPSGSAAAWSSFPATNPANLAGNSITNLSMLEVDNYASGGSKTLLRGASTDSVTNDLIVLGTEFYHQRAGGAFKLWDAGNDGSGSGLDSDLLDGLNSDAFAGTGTVSYVSNLVVAAQNTGNSNQSTLGFITPRTNDWNNAAGGTNRWNLVASVVEATSNAWNLAVAILNSSSNLWNSIANTVGNRSSTWDTVTSKLDLVNTNTFVATNTTAGLPTVAGNQVRIGTNQTASGSSTIYTNNSDWVSNATVAAVDNIGTNNAFGQPALWKGTLLFNDGATGVGAALVYSRNLVTGATNDIQYYSYSGIASGVISNDFTLVVCTNCSYQIVDQSTGIGASTVLGRNVLWLVPGGPAGATGAQGSTGATGATGATSIVTLAQTNLTGITSAFTLSWSTYYPLLRVRVRAALTNTGNAGLQFNGDTGLNYQSGTRGLFNVYSTGNTVAGTNTANLGFPYNSSAANSGNIPGLIDIWIDNNTNTTKAYWGRTDRLSGTGTATFGEYILAGSWPSNAATTSLTMTAHVGSVCGYSNGTTAIVEGYTGPTP